MEKKTYTRPCTDISEVEGEEILIYSVDDIIVADPDEDVLVIEQNEASELL